MNCPKCGAQVATGAKFCPSCGAPAPIGGVRWRVVILLLLALIAGGWLVSLMPRGTSPATRAVARPAAPQTQERPDLELLEHRATIDSLGWMTITGRVRNNTARTYRYAQISFQVYNAADELLGPALANVTGLEPGQVWQFSAVYTGQGGRRYKLDSLTGF